MEKNPFLCQWSFMLSSFSFSCHEPDITRGAGFVFFANLVTIRYFGVKKEEKKRRKKSIKYKTTRNDELFTIFFLSVFISLWCFFKNNLTFLLFLSTSSSFHAHQMRFSADNDSVNIEKNVYGWCIFRWGLRLS